MTATNVIRGAILVAVGALVVGGSALGIASPAQAHNYLVSSTPAAGQTLTELPAAFVITTNQPLLVLDGQTGGFALQVTDSAGLHYETGCVSVEGAAMTMADPRLGATGAYTVEWQVVSADGHSVSGSIPFTWAPATGTEAAAGSASAPTCGDEPPAAGQPSATAVAQPPATQTPTAIRLSDVLWVGGAIVAVGIAVIVAILVTGRRRRS